MKNKSDKAKCFWIATGGTGGHIFPALAVANELMQRGHSVVVSTDRRGIKYVRRDLGFKLTVVWASGVGAKNIIFRIWSLFKIFVSTVILSARFIFSRPYRIVAFGGYSSVPVLIAGWIWGIPTFLHEQNAAIGRANKFAMPFVKTLMTSFHIGCGVYTGLPVRKEFRVQSSEFRETGRILITGGSLGANILDEIVPEAILRLKDKKKLFVIHQTRPENVEKLRKEYARIGVKNNVLPFIKDMAGELSRASLVIGRAGASTTVEMQTVGVPAILIPLGINPDQLANARAFAKTGGAVVIEQKDLSPKLLAKTLGGLVGNPEKLKRMAAAAYVPNNALENIIGLITE